MCIFVLWTKIVSALEGLSTNRLTLPWLFWSALWRSVSAIANVYFSLHIRRAPVIVRCSLRKRILKKRWKYFSLNFFFWHRNRREIQPHKCLPACHDMASGNGHKASSNTYYQLAIDLASKYSESFLWSNDFKNFEGNLLIYFWSTFLLQIVSGNCFCWKENTEIVWYFWPLHARMCKGHSTSHIFDRVVLYERFPRVIIVQLPLTRFCGSKCVLKPVHVWQFGGYLYDKWNFQKIFDGEMWIKVQPKTPLQFFCEFMINSKVILKSIKSADETCQEDLQAWMG